MRNSIHSPLRFGILFLLSVSISMLFSRFPVNGSGIFDSPLGTQPTPMPIFLFPVVPNVPISGYFDHRQIPTSSGEDFQVTFYNGRSSPQSEGFYFSCSGIGDGNFWVGCSVPSNNTESSCPDASELWYDNHKGVDFEYVTEWHTGDACADPSIYQGITHPVYLPAAGKVIEINNNPANGNFVRVAHDIDGDGSVDDDRIRSVHLHFAQGLITVSVNQWYERGVLLGLGGMTGFAWTPHLHFEVQRANDEGFIDKWSVDPYGWQGFVNDPWPHENANLRQYVIFAPGIRKN